MNGVTVHIANTKGDYEIAKELFSHYSEWCKINFIKHKLFGEGTSEFSAFNNEPIPGIYNDDKNFILLIKQADQARGCVFLRMIDKEICEMKRFYIKPEHRGLNLGKTLLDTLIVRCRKAGYRFLRICSHSAFMHKAVDIYRKYGFYKIDPFVDDPMQGGDIQMELKLN